MTRAELCALKRVKYLLNSAIEYFDSGRVGDGVDLIKAVNINIDMMIPAQGSKKGKANEQ